MRIKIIVKLLFVGYLCVIMECSCGMKREIKKEISNADGAKVRIGELGVGGSRSEQGENREKKRIQEQMSGLYEQVMT